MKFIEFTVHTTTEGSELIADIFWNYTNYGVTVCDVNDIIALQSDNTYIYFLGLHGRRSDAKSERRACKMLPSHRHRGRKHPLHSRRFRAAQRAQRGLCSSARWKLPAARSRGTTGSTYGKTLPPLAHRQKGGGLPRVDPLRTQGRGSHRHAGFQHGVRTGEHETTSMCLELLQEYLKEGDTVVDRRLRQRHFGIAALKLGAKFAYMTDIDYVAVKSATHNCKRNGVADRAKVALSDLLETRTCAAK